MQAIKKKDGPLQKVEEWEKRISDFMRENHEFLAEEEPDLDAVARVYTHAADLMADLTAEMKAISLQCKKAGDEAAAVIRDKHASPGTVRRKKRRCTRLEREYQQRKELADKFWPFVWKARELESGLAPGEGMEGLDENIPLTTEYTVEELPDDEKSALALEEACASLREPKRSWWREFLGFA